MSFYEHRRRRHIEGGDGHLLGVEGKMLKLGRSASANVYKVNSRCDRSYASSAFKIIFSSECGIAECLETGTTLDDSPLLRGSRPTHRKQGAAVNGACVVIGPACHHDCVPSAAPPKPLSNDQKQAARFARIASSRCSRPRFTTRLPRMAAYSSVATRWLSVQAVAKVSPSATRYLVAC